MEDGEELVFDLMETVVNGVLNVIHEKHMETNLIPFSLDWAENIMVNITHFLVTKNIYSNNISLI